MNITTNVLLFLSGNMNQCIEYNASYIEYTDNNNCFSSSCVNSNQLNLFINKNCKAF